MEPALQINGLTKEYPGFKLDHVSFTLPCGTIMGLIGENGAGKSTTINAVLDLIRKDDGNILFWGKELSHNPRQLKEDIGVVFDGINFYETLTPSRWVRSLPPLTASGIRLPTKAFWNSSSCLQTRKSKPFPRA